MAALAYFVTTLRAKFEEKEKGATAVEYGLIIALISIVLVTAFVLLNEPITGAINGVIAEIGG